MILAPLRGVTIRCFREVFSAAIREAGFTEAITPFIPAIRGFDPLKDRELGRGESELAKVTPQFIGKDPEALRVCLRRIRAAGWTTADLNSGCPFPMVRNKGRGSGLLRTPEVLRRMLEAGCETMGEHAFSIKTRLGVDSADELEKIMPIINDFPLRFLTVHGRIARQMYEGEVDFAAVERVVGSSKVPIVLNGDMTVDSSVPAGGKVIDIMVGRAFVRSLGERDDIDALLADYIERSANELSGDRPVLGRLKELISYFKDSPRWQRRWQVIKRAASVEELRSCLKS